MRQIRFAGAGGPDVLTLETVPLPQPGPGQVLIEVVSAGVNRPDIQQREGKYPPPKGATEIPGLEVAGRIAALGEGAEVSPSATRSAPSPSAAVTPNSPWPRPDNACRARRRSR